MLKQRKETIRRYCDETKCHTPANLATGIDVKCHDESNHDDKAIGEQVRDKGHPTKKLLEGPCFRDSTQVAFGRNQGARSVQSSGRGKAIPLILCLNALPGV
jgi:hypothetical protein